MNEGLRLGADAQQSELQLIATYNLGHLARELGDHERAADTYELAMELAERIGLSEVQIGALAGLALSKISLGDWDGATRLHERLLPLVEGQPEWFKNREFFEALSIHLAVRRGERGIFHRFAAAVELAEERDVFGASWLIAEVGLPLLERAPDELYAVVKRFAGRPEVLDSPQIRDRFGVLMLDSKNSVDQAR